MIWGKLIAVLRQRCEMSLLVACGDIVDVDIIEENFVINIDDNSIYEIVHKEENLKTLKNIFESLGHQYNIVLNKKEKQHDLVQKDIEYLKKLVGDKLKIKG